MDPLPPVAAWVARQGGIAHSSVVHAAGHRENAVRSAVAAGALGRIRRSWLATSDAPPARVAAATVGGRVTCVSAAELLGLWTPAHHEHHVAVRPGASRLETTGLVLHWAQGPAPVAPRSAEDPVLNVLFHVARCLDRADALAVWESALRKGLVESEVLERVAWPSPRARELAAIAGSLSDAGTETQFVELMRRVGIRVRQQVWIDGHPVDGLIGERLAVQIDGFAHHQGRDRRRDLRADARLVLRGYTMLRFDFHQVFFDSDYVVDTVVTAVAQRRHLAA